MPVSLTAAKTIASHVEEPLRTRLSRGTKSGEKAIFFRDVLSYRRMRTGNYASPRDLVPRSGNAITLHEDGQIKSDFFNHCF